MRILVISNSEWDDQGAGGNTLSNWFGGWNNSVFFNVYPRLSLPNNTCCKEYYSVSPFSLIRFFFRPSKVGRRFSVKEQIIVSRHQKKEKKVISWIHKRARGIAYLINDFLYDIVRWQNDKYVRFIKECNPDIVFSFATGDTFRRQNLEYVKQHTHAKIITFVADDVYTIYSDRSSVLMRRYKKNFEDIMYMSDMVYGASEMMCSEYGRLFNIQMKPLYKGCHFMGVKDVINNPLRIVYAGNLQYGRINSLAKIADVLEVINQHTIKCYLEIYTGSDITPEINEKLNRKQSSRICGPRPYETIKQILHQADIVLQVESFEPQQQKIVRFSFSTKITDCMQSGSVLMVIGPKGISSVEYTKNIPGVLLATDPDEIGNLLKNVLNNPMELLSRAKQIHEFSIRNHSLNSVRKALQHDFNEVIRL